MSKDPSSRTRSTHAAHVVIGGCDESLAPANLTYSNGRQICSAFRPHQFAIFLYCRCKLRSLVIASIRTVTTTGSPNHSPSIHLDKPPTYQRSLGHLSVPYHVAPSRNQNTQCKVSLWGSRHFIMPFFKELRRRKTVAKPSKTSPNGSSASTESNGTVPTTKSSSTLSSFYGSNSTTASSIQQSTPNLILTASKPSPAISQPSQRPIALGQGMASNRNSVAVRVNYAERINAIPS